ncbi:DNA translocase FtsK [Paenibacillus cremeus]|uniref:FtsK gamma domain-containing protein n=1 Tax=Paenibacillus cremeus TaxID=2163881 RepID=A0A559KCM2_9BACL|nr:DNA translocase FtsK [Paenibacillus cremeus]TVY09875.1 hypothetical protein FPZ49_10915 [Paenibacillus cremeus]
MAKKPKKEENERWEAFLRQQEEEKYPLAVAAVIKAKESHPENEAYASVSLLQRTCRVGYKQGERLINRMVDEKILEPEVHEHYTRYRVIG